jgi:hypothetical protein
MMYTWWCWHICKGEEVGEEKQLKALVTGWPDASGICLRRQCSRCDWTHPISIPDASGILSRHEQSHRGDQTLPHSSVRTLNNHCSCIKSWWPSAQELIQRGSNTWVHLVSDIGCVRLVQDGSRSSLDSTWCCLACIRSFSSIVSDRSCQSVTE